MARIDKGLIILVGRDRENPRTHRDAFQITGGLGEVLDKHIKRNNLNKSEFIREAIAAKLEAEMPKEPLIKDEAKRSVFKAWAEILGRDLEKADFKYDAERNGFDCYLAESIIEFANGEGINCVDREIYTFRALCGEDEE